MSTALKPPPGHLVRIPSPDGTETTWVTTDRAAHQLQVDHGLVRVWVHRNRARLERRREGGRTWYRLEQLAGIEAESNERLTRESGKRP